MGGVPLMYLTTIGAKTGQQRTVPVMAFPDGDDAWLVVASSGGTATHPAWFYNLAKHPDRVELEYEGRKTPAVPETLAGEARAAAWARITADQKRFADYETKTDREIPVVRLSAR
jgi:deazaflavin-dependent oxidoreductase (nitroreductase family)